MKSGLRQAGEILILIGAILSTISQAVLILVTFFIWTIPGAVVIVFTWVTRNKVLKSGSRNWTIFGIVLGALTDWIGLAGYICLLIEDIQNENSNYVTVETQKVDNQTLESQTESQAESQE